MGCCCSSQPADLPQDVKTKRILLSEEAMGGHVFFRKFRAPRQYMHSAIHAGKSVAIAVAEDGLYIYIISPLQKPPPIRFLTAPWSDPRLHQMQISVENGRLALTFEAPWFSDKFSGTVGLRALTEQAEQFRSLIQKQIEKNESGEQHPNAFNGNSVWYVG